MTSFAQKSAFALTFAAALLAGCSSNDAPKKVKAPAPTEAEVEQQTRAFFAPRGETVVSKDHCNVQTNRYEGDAPDSCGFKVEKTQDDGLLRSITMDTKGQQVGKEYCEFRPDGAVAGKMLDKIEKAFQHDARYKFGKMGFEVFDTFAESQSYMHDCDNAYTMATFLVRSREGVFSADFKESFNLESGAFGLIVSDLKPVSKPGAAPRAAAEDNGDTSETPTSSTPRREKSSESKICVGSCVGPHLDLQTGKVKNYGTGPGYKF